MPICDKLIPTNNSYSDFFSYFFLFFIFILTLITVIIWTGVFMNHLSMLLIIVFNIVSYFQYFIFANNFFFNNVKLIYTFILNDLF